MTRKCHNHTLQTNPRHCEEEAKNDKTSYKSKATNYIFPSVMITKLERTQSIT